MAELTKEYIDKTFKDIIKDIEDNKSLRASLKLNKLSSQTFYKWLDNDKEMAKQYARACEIRADNIFEEILTISDHTEEDHTPFTGGNVVQRDRVRIDARKWYLSKVNPKKYGDKIDHTTDGDKINSDDRKIIINYAPPKEE